MELVGVRPVTAQATVRLAATRLHLLQQVQQHRTAFHVSQVGMELVAVRRVSAQATVRLVATRLHLLQLGLRRLTALPVQWVPILARLVAVVQPTAPTAPMVLRTLITIQQHHALPACQASMLLLAAQSV